MTSMSYDAIAPLISDLNVQGRTVSVRFRCPLTGQEVNARHSMPRRNDIGSQVSNQVRRSLAYNMQSMMSSMVRSIFGSGAVGRTASSAAYTAMSNVTRGASNPTLSDAEQHEAVVAAFQSVARSFVYDPNRQQWISSKAAGELMSGFQRQSTQHPITHPYDRQLLARMLVEVARADGQLSREEDSWLTDLLAADMGSVQSLANRPPLSAAELDQASSGPVRETMLMTAWALALSDERFDEPERVLLERYANAFKLSGARLDGVRQLAQTHLLNQAMERMFSWGGHDNHAREQVFALAARLGMSRAEAEQAEARFQRQNAYN